MPGMRVSKKQVGRRRTLEQTRKDAEALNLHCQGKSYQAIADALGWKGKGTAFHAVKRALADLQREPLEQFDHFTAAIERIHAGLRECQQIIETPHYLAAPGGKLATAPDGTLVLDDGPKQRAITEMRHLNDQLIMLMDLKPATKSRVEVVTEDVVDREIAKLAEELANAQGGKPPVQGP
jgi:hypothetical protein